MALPYQRRHQAQKSKNNSNSKLLSSNSTVTVALDILKNKPFWIWDKSEHLQLAQKTNQNCCFNHICGLPRKDGKEYPLFDYEKIIYDNLIAGQNVTNKSKPTSLS